MNIEGIFDATRAGLDNERLRLDVASRNIASANQPIAPGVATTRAEFAGLVGGDAVAVEDMANGAAHVAGEAPVVATRAVHDPNHPLADADGNVHYPDIDLVTEMTTLMTASRGYEANVRAFNLLRGMVLRALEIGAK
jgi:flagellar basal-body rod protein FlgC